MSTFNAKKNSDQKYVGISSEFCIFYFTHKAIAWYEWLTFGVKTSVHDQETQCWIYTYALSYQEETENGFMKYALNHDTYQYKKLLTTDKYCF